MSLLNPSFMYVSHQYILHFHTCSCRVDPFSLSLVLFLYSHNIRIKRHKSQWLNSHRCNAAHNFSLCASFPIDAYLLRAYRCNISYWNNVFVLITAAALLDWIEPKLNEYYTCMNDALSITSAYTVKNMENHVTWEVSMALGSGCVYYHFNLFEFSSRRVVRFSLFRFYFN